MKRIALLAIVLIAGCAAPSQAVVTCHGISPVQCYDLARDKCHGNWYPNGVADFEPSSGFGGAEGTFHLYIRCGTP